jgi:tRNA-splicing endonuclease subunit Sen34
MTPSVDSVSEPVPISLIAGRYLLFDVNVVTYLRRTYHICGVLIGSIPQVPQQNVFLGLPVELIPEEAKLLVEKEVAYVVDDTAWHNQSFGTFQGEDRKRYLESLRSQGLNARKVAENASRKRSEKALGKQATLRSRKEALKDSNERRAEDEEESSLNDTSMSLNSESQELSLFNDDRPSSRGSSTISTSNVPYAITPTTSYTPSSLPQNPALQANPPVPSSYPLFAHLHSRDYFVMPGLRFGCDYNVYPGDPLRFHSHFLAVGYDWNQDIPMLDLIGGGRLGTAVKKGFLIGGEDVEAKSEGDKVRTFCIEWGGM